jgi:hypothetical protein
MVVPGSPHGYLVVLPPKPGEPTPPAPDVGEGYDGCDACCCGGAAQWYRPFHLFEPVDPVPCRLWVTGEYLLWWIKDAPVPVPLVTTGAANPLTGGGVLGRASTFELFGDSGIDQPTLSGGRFTAGYWLDAEQGLGVEASFLFLAERTFSFRVNSEPTGFPVLASPVVDANSGIETASLIAFPGAFAGGVTVSASSQLWGMEFNAVRNVVCAEDITVDMLGGFRYLDLSEDLNIARQRTVLPAGVDRFLGTPVFAGNNLMLVDDFHTRDQFYGGQIGGRAEYRYGKFFVDALGKVAFGDVHQVVEINGNTTLTPPAGTVSTASGGLLALPSNIGRFTHDTFAVVPEAGLTAGLQVTCHVRAFVGYSFLYCSDVARPGDQINRTVNPAQLPTSRFFTPGPANPAQPAPLFNTTEYWAQGINFGVAFTY